jgi:hypothetical protein
VSRLLIPRLLTTGSVVGATTALRIGAASAQLLARRTPPLLGLALRGSLGGPETARTQATFRDELIALAREGAETSWREMRRGVDQLDASTRPPDPSAGGPPRRPYRVKP